MTRATTTTRLLAFTALAAFAASCAPPAPPPPPPARAQRVMYEWHDDGGPGEVAIEIRLAKQRAVFTRGGRPIGWTFVATGREGFNTRPGNYRITEMVVDKYSNRYGWHEDEYGTIVNPSVRYNVPVPPGLRYVPAPMPYWMRLTDYGIGLHAGPIPLPGAPASHGCIRVPDDLAPRLYSAVRLGTPVKIVP